MEQQPKHRGAEINRNLRADNLRSTSATSDVTPSSHDPCSILETIVSDARIYKMGIITNSTYDYSVWCFLYVAMISKKKQGILVYLTRKGGLNCLYT
jgi:hypothetical protein